MKVLQKLVNVSLKNKFLFFCCNYLNDLLEGKKLLFTLLLAFFLQANYSQATHIVGGTLTYVYKGDSIYTVTLKLYRDCSPTSAQFPGSVTIYVRGNNGQTFSPSLDFAIPRGLVTPIDDNLDSCAIPPDPMPCVEEGIYSMDVTLPPNPGGYHLYFQLIARNLSLTNIDAACNCIGETFYAQIPGQTVAWYEPFTFPNGTTIDNGTTAWSITNGAVAPASAEVNGNDFEIDGNLNATFTWSSEVIDISTYSTGVGVHLNLSETGNFQSTDTIKVYYSLDGGTPILFSTNGQLINDFASAVASQSGLYGSSLQIFVQTIFGPTSTTTETYIIDNVTLWQQDFEANSNPVFNDFPPLFVCVGDQLVFDHSATDLDGDSLVYGLYTPYDGENGTGPLDPSFSGNTAVFTPITYEPGYSYQNPLGGAPITIDPITGLLTGVPPTIGQFVVGIKVQEYRNGILISETLRDFQFNSVICPPPAQALLSPFSSCSGNNVTFFNQGDTTYTTTWWDFGNPLVTTDTSILNTPSYSYPDTGNYIVTLITNKRTSCADTATTNVYVGWVNSDFTYTNSQCASIPVDFTNSSTISNNGTFLGWNWDFGDGTSATTQNTSHIYNSPGNYTVILTSSSSLGCSDTAMVVITIGPRPTVDAGSDQTVCASSPDVSLNGSVANTTGGTWTSSGTGTFTPSVTSLNATYTPSAADISNGFVNVILTSTGASICKSTDTVRITISAQPTNSNAGTDQLVCGVTTTLLSANSPGVGTGVWSIVSGAATIDDVNSPTTSVLGLVAGNSYTFQWTVTNGATCTSSDLVVVSVDLLPTAANAGTNQVLCNTTSATLNGNAPTVGSGLWTVIAGTGTITNPTSANSNVTGLIAGDTVTLRWTISQGVCNSYDDILIIIDVLRTSNAGSNQTLCNQGTTVQLNGTISVASSAEWGGGLGSFTANNTILNAAYHPTPAEILTGYVNLILTTTDNGVCPAAKDTVKINFVPFDGTITNIPLNPSCLGFSDGSITVNIAGTATPYSYTWNTVPQQYLSTATNLAAGTHTVIIYDGRGCSSNQSFTLTQPAVLTGTINATTVSCKNGNDGTATVTASGGNSNYTYSWSTGETNASISGLVASSYNVTVTDDKGCSINKSVTITEPTLLSGSLSPLQVSCNGGNDASISVNATGGTAPYTYTWAPNVSSSASASNLIAGLYSVTVVDNIGCSITLSTTITQPTPLVLTPSQTNVSCFEGSNGSAIVSVSGGTSGYSYTWSSSITSVTNTATNLTEGNYSVTVNDSKQCNQVITFNISEPSELISSVSSANNVSCFGGSNGAIELSTVGGITTYNYSWIPNVSTSNAATNLTSGDYIVFVSDQNNCSTSVNVTLSQPTDLQVSETHTQLSCFESNDGTITAIVVGGTKPYNYSWNIPGIGNQPSFAALPQGTHSILATDSNNCSGLITVTLTQPDSITITSTIVNSTCSQSNGSASVSVIGGVTPYTYSWNVTDSISNQITQMPANPYQVEVSDANGCTSIEYILINDFEGPTIILTTVNNVTCFGGNDGSAQAVVINGTQPFTYTWNTTPIQNTQTAVGLYSGVYAVSVTDSNGCVTSAYTTPPITEPDSLTYNFTTYSASCYETATGAIKVTPFGGTPGYTINWTNPNVTSDSIGLLLAGTYNFTIIDSNNCTKSGALTVNEPSLLSTNQISIADVSCFGEADGSATVSASGGTSPYSYSWNPSTQSGSSAFLLNAGNYSVFVTDANQCKDTLEVMIIQPSDAVMGTIISNDVLCYGGNSGGATVSGAGGNGGFTYTWQPIQSFGNTISNLSEGNYTVQVVDQKGCNEIIPYTITQPSKIMTNANVNSSTCGYTNASITTQVNGGIEPFTYSWSPTLGSDSVIYNIGSGTYYLDVTDANACVHRDTFVVNNIIGPQISAVSKSNVSCNGLNDGSIKISTTAIAYPLLYNWTPSVSNDSVFASLTSGNYTIIVIDNNGCSDTTGISISEPSNLLIDSIIVTNVLCYEQNDGTAEINVSGGTPSYKYIWSNGFTGSSSTNLPKGTYEITVRDSNGCEAQQSFNIEQPSELISNIIFNESNKCNGDTLASVTANVMGGTFPYSYDWDNGQPLNTVTINNLGAGDYEVHVNDANGCETHSHFDITEPPPVQLILNGSKIICLGRNATLTANASSGNGAPFTYSWQPGTSITKTQVVAPSSTTIYTVYATDKNGCKSPIDTAKITVYSLTSGDITVNLKTPICPGTTTTLSAVSSGSNTGPLTYTWNNGIGNGPGEFTLTPEKQTTYTVTVATTCGTAVTKSATVKFISAPKAIIGSDKEGGCPPLDVVFNDLSVPVGTDTINEWVWDFGNGITSTEQNPTIQFPNTGTYYVSLKINTVGGCTKTTVENAYFITVHPVPKAGFSVATPVVYIPKGKAMCIDNSIEADYGYWHWGDGAVTKIVSNTHTYNDVGNYEIKQVVSNKFGCKDSTVKPIVVSGEIFIPNAFTPNTSGPNGGGYDPNDLSNDVFFPQLKGVVEFKMQIFNRWGELIFESNDYKIGWDGYYRNQLCQQDVYVYRIWVTFNDGRNEIKTGDVTLLR